MELKVLVDGVERVVCGITEQTTVQEVVIALAQATGRTGRYTLVERYRDNERLLPPAETPLTVLQRWGPHQEDVAFILRRSGTSEIKDASKFDKNQQIRQSLPAQSKPRRNGIQEERNKNNRKSLGPGMRIRGDSSSSLPLNTQVNPQRGFNPQVNSSPALVQNMRSRSPQRRLSPTRNMRPPSKTRQPSPNRGLMDSRMAREKSVLNRVVLDQQQTLKELEEILGRLNAGISKYEQIQGKGEEERRLSEIVRINEQKLLDEKERRTRNDSTRKNLEGEIRQCKQELHKIDSQIQKNHSLERNYSKQIDEQKRELEIQKQIKNRDASTAQNELRQVAFDVRRVDQEIHEKNDQIEKLNRDLRKVNLQSFVRETNSTKVTVLPESNSRAPPDPPTRIKPEAKNEASSGVWV